MDLNRSNMDALFATYRVAFSEGMARGRGLPPELQAELIKLNELAMVLPAGGASVVHAWLNQMPGYREWIGDRQVKNIESGKIEVLHKDWEDTVSIPRNDILDDQYGLYTPLIQDLGAEGSDEALWLDMAVDVLLANGNWADDAAFFGAARKYGANTILNYVTSALAQTALETAFATMASYKGHNNNPLNVVPAILLVGPSKRNTAWDLVKNQFVAGGAVQVQNRCQGRALLRTHPKLIGAYANYWFLLASRGSMKAVAVQRRQEAQLVRKDQPTDDNVFNSKTVIYGADARGAAFLTMPHLAYMSTGSA
jgi:phage major head subunit gpT-like protein